MSINVHNEEITYLRSPIITCLNIDFRRIKLQQIVLFGINLCLRLGKAKPGQYYLDALKKKMGAAKHIVCDSLCAMDAERHYKLCLYGAHIIFFYFHLFNYVKIISYIIYFYRVINLFKLSL